MASIFKMKSGKWRAQVRELGGGSASKVLGTKAEARKWAAWAETEMAKGKRVDAGKLRFGDLLDAYTDAHRAMSRSKVSGLNMLRKMLGAQRLQDMARGQVYLDFTQRREKAGAGPATILQDLSYVRTVLVGGGTLKDADVSQPLAALTGVRRMLASQGRVSKPVERTRRPVDGELLTLFDRWRRNPTREIPMEDLTLFAVGTAMRLGEIVRLRWGDLDADKRTILIRDRKHPRQKKGNDQTVPLLAGPFRLNGQLVDPLAIILKHNRMIITVWLGVDEHGPIDALSRHSRHVVGQRIFEPGVI